MATTVKGLATIAEASEYLHLSRMQIHRYVEAGKLRVVRFGRAVRLRWADLEAFIAANTDAQ